MNTAIGLTLPANAGQPAKLRLLLALARFHR